MYWACCPAFRLRRLDMHLWRSSFRSPGLTARSCRCKLSPKYFVRTPDWPCVEGRPSGGAWLGANNKGLPETNKSTNPDLQQDSYRLSRLPKPRLSRILLSIDFRCTLTDVCQFGQCQQLHAALSLRLPSPAGRNQDWNVMNLIWKYMERVQRGFTNQDMPRHW